MSILSNVLQICKFSSLNLCGLEEGINSPLMLPLQVSNIYLIELLYYALQFHQICGSEV